MKNKKSLFLLIFIFLLVGSSLYLVYVIQDGRNPLALLNSRASEDGLVDEFGTLAQNGESPTPTIEYSSTSPTPSTTVTTSPQPSPSVTAGVVTPTLTPTPSPTLTPTRNPTPTKALTPTAVTTVTELPVAGVTDFFNPFTVSAGAGVLVILALLL